MSRLKTAMAMEPPDIDSEDDADDIGLQAGSSRLEPIDAEPGLRVTPRATSFGSQLDSPDIPLLAMLEEELGRVATPALDYEFSAPSLPRLKSSASFKSMGTSTSSRGRPPSRNDTRQFFQEVFDAEMKAPSLFDAEIRPEPASDSDGSPVTRRPRASKRSEAIARSKQKRQLKSYMKHLKQLLAGEPAALELLGDGAALEMLLDAVTTTLGDPDDLLLLDAAGVMDILYSICIGTSKSDRSEAMEEFLEACRRSEAGLPPAPSRGRGKDRGSTGRAKGNSKEETALEQVYNGGRRGRRTVKSEDRRVPDGNGSCDATASANDSSSSLSDDEYRRLGDSTDLSDLSPKPAASSSTSEVWIDSSDGAGPSSGFLRRPIVQRRISRTKDGQIVTQGRRRVQAEPPTPTREPIPTAEFFVSPGARAASNRIQTPGFAVDPDSLDELPASSTGRRRPRPRYRNPRHSSPYHLVPEEQSMQADPDGPNPDGRTCRICLSEDNWISMLAPCACDGSAKWVHRVCLARWRKTATNVLSKVQCEVCHSYYRLSRSAPTKYGLESHLTLNTMTIICQIWLLLYYMLLTYVVGFATRVAANLLPANLLILPELPDSFALPTPTMTPTGASITETVLDDQLLHSSAIAALLAVKLLFTLLQILNRIRLSWDHLPLSLFMLGAYNRLSDRVVFLAGSIMCLAPIVSGTLWPLRSLGDILWLTSVIWAIPSLWQDTKRRARSMAPRLLLLLFEMGDTADDEVLNHED